MDLKIRLAVLNFLHMGAWGAYLISLGSFLGAAGLGQHIGAFFAVIGLVSLFAPPLAGILADRFFEPVRLLGLCHFLSAICLLGMWKVGSAEDAADHFWLLYVLFIGVSAFYMSAYSLILTVCYALLRARGFDPVKHFPPLRVYGTVGFICLMWATDLLGWQLSAAQFALGGMVSVLLLAFTYTLPLCGRVSTPEARTWVQRLGLDALVLFKRRELAFFFLFVALIGINLQVTNAFGTPYLNSFALKPEYAQSLVVQHTNILYSLSQVSECLCLLCIPFFMGRFGIRAVMLLAMLAWTLRFLFLGLGNPGEGLWLLLLSMLVYGFAFDFFAISCSIYIDMKAPPALRASAQGLMWMMANGVGSTAGATLAQQVVDAHTIAGVIDWQPCWFIFAGYAAAVMVAFFVLFRPQAGEEPAKGAA